MSESNITENKLDAREENVDSSSQIEASEDSSGSTAEDIEKEEINNSVEKDKPNGIPSPENAADECNELLPFQTLAVELDEGNNSPNTAVDDAVENDDAVKNDDAVENVDAVENDDAIESEDAVENDNAIENDDTVESTVSTVLSNPEINADAEEIEDNGSPSEITPATLLEQSMVSNDDDDDDNEAENEATNITPDTLMEQSIVSNGDTEPADDSTEGRAEMVCMPPEVMDDAAMDYDDVNLFMQTSEQGLQENAKSYLEDFLLSAPGSSSVGGIDSDSTSQEEKGSPLHRFPKIVKAMETADYATLQVLYRLLYLRNAWDTEKILAQRILDFSGFNCDPTSEDYYTRELMLRTVSCDVLLSIGKLLCIENLVTTTDFDKLKIDIVSKIMTFLYKPRRRAARRSRPAAGSARKASRGGRGGRNQQRSRTSESLENSVSPSSRVSLKTAKGNKSGFNENEKTSPQKTKTSLTEEELLRIETALKKDVAEGKALQPKVDLKRLDLKDFRLFSGKSSPSKSSKDEDDSSDTNYVGGSETKKLRDFSSVLSSIEGTPDELLSDIHSLLFLDKGTPSSLKEKILDFNGFAFETESEEYRKRIDCLKSMNETTVKDVARALFLDPKSDKEATIILLLTFLKKPSDKYLRPTVIESGMLSDCDFDIENMSDLDSDDSITCEVVHKKVEYVDLISDGEGSDKEGKKVTIKKEKEDKPANVLPKIESVEQVKTVVTQQPAIEQSMTSITFVPGQKRTLRDFETITKIVNTHPTEYLVDIYNLLYMVNYEPSTLRKDILDFGGFEFEKGTTDYIKRKQFLDRMLYNSVRRIYNTLIHNTREVKVFSKPTMIGEIFQFLFKLPDHDTSIRPPPPKPNVVAPYSLGALSRSTTNTVNANLAVAAGIGNIPIPSQPGKLSDLKRVFQRVACFPCEYLIDVHKLLFMTDCDMKDIRANIFGFKGFSFDVDSPEFNQRKLYLEYLTFHSLRKISSVLTTKTVDLRNSTKHELASHLTEVLKEYTNTSFETEAIGNMNPGSGPIVTTAFPSTSADSAVEQIVVTPIIPSLRPSPTGTPDTLATVSSEDNMTVTSSTSGNPKNTAAKGRRQTQAKPKSAKNKIVPSNEEDYNNTGSQFEDVNLPEIEKYRSMFQPSLGMSQSDCPPVEPLIPNQAYAYRPEFMLQQGPYGSMMPQPVPYLQPFPQPIHLQSPYMLPQAAVQPTMKTDDDPRSMLEVTLEEAEPAAKRMKGSGGSELHIVDSHSLAADKSDALHLKIRDAMTKASEDEEDCDKPLSALLGHPNDKILKQQICEIVESTDLQEITMNGVIQKIFSMYPKFNLNYRKEFIKSTLRSLLYRLGENHNSNTDSSNSTNIHSGSPDCSVSTTDPRDSPEISSDSPSSDKWKASTAAPASFQKAKRKR